MSPAERLKQILLKKNLNIAVAESLTAGLVQFQIASVSGSSSYFLGGITAYNLDQKVRQLHVERSHAESVDCVSSTVAEQMALGVRQRYDAVLSVSTTGYAEPYPERSINEPFAYFAFSDGKNLEVGRIEAPDRSRVEVQWFVATEVLKHLIRWLESSKSNP